MDRAWSRDGDRFRSEFGGRAWLLDLSEGPSGLVANDEAIGPILRPDRISLDGVPIEASFTRDALVELELRLGRVEAVFVPKAMPDLRVRAAWSLGGEGVVDLEIQAQTFTVDDPRSIEVGVVTDLDEVLILGGEAAPCPGRDRSTLPISRADLLAPTLGRSGSNPDRLFFYLEIAHPEDGMRRGVEATDREGRGRVAIRWSMFGCPMEKGVIRRGRLRGHLLAREPGPEEIAASLSAFLGDPLPLGI